MDYEKAWFELSAWLARHVVDDCINGLAHLDTLEKMDEMWNKAHNMEDNSGV